MSIETDEDKIKRTTNALILADNPWFKVLSNVLVLSLILFVISLFVSSWSEGRIFFGVLFVASAVAIFILIKTLKKDKK